MNPLPVKKTNTNKRENKVYAGCLHNAARAASHDIISVFPGPTSSEVCDMLPGIVGDEARIAKKEFSLKIASYSRSLAF